MAQQTPSNKLMRILALHGHRQSGDIFAKKTGALKKILSPLGVSFIHYPTAPHKLAEKNEDGEDVFSWFNWEPLDKWNEPTSYSGVEQTIEFLKQQFIEYGPFDGVLGFSQGGIVASVLAGMRVPREVSNNASNPISFDFAIFAATFAPLVSEYFFYTMNSNKCAPLATLHVYGSGDPLVPSKMSKGLAAEFEAQAQTPASENDLNEKKIYRTTVMHLEHAGGHFVATNSASKQVYRQFFEQFAADFPRIGQ